MVYAKIPCKNRVERDAVERAMQDPVMAATAKIVGILLPVEEDERRRVMAYLKDRFIDNPPGGREC